MNAASDRSMRAYRLAYDGTGYHGFQRQPDVATVEDALLTALARLEVIPSAADPPPGYAAAGRTDAGVSALAQTVAFQAPPWLTPRAFTAGLPDDVWAWAAATPDPGFHATHDAASRTYEYHLRLDRTRDSIGRAESALEALTGRHDYHNLTPDETNTVRTVSASGRVEAPYYVVTVTAGGFPRQLVRRLVSVVDAVAHGAADLDGVNRLLEGPPVDGPEGIAPADPEPLLLVDVDYPGLGFEPDQPALASATEALAARRDLLERRARVADRLRGCLARHGEETD